MADRKEDEIFAQCIMMHHTRLAAHKQQHNMCTASPATPFEFAQACVTLCLCLPELPKLAKHGVSVLLAL